MKKTIYAVLPLLVALVMFWTGAGNDEAKVSMAAETLGDVTNDGTINQDDMDALVNHLLQETEVDETNANVDAEEGLDVRDVMRYQRYIYYQRGIATNDVNDEFTGWYYEDTTKSEYTIENGKELYGLSEIVAGGKQLNGITINLADDVIVNARGCDWKTPGMSFSNEGLMLSWTPIGTSSNAFRGNFNGGGHTIAGLYMEGTQRMGLFGTAFRTSNVGGNIGNFDLKDTYIKSTGAFNGSVVGLFRGNITSVYSDATIEIAAYNSSGISTGGIVGQLVDENVTIENCWYAGNLTTQSPAAGGIVGLYNIAKTLTIENCLVSGTLTTNIPSSGVTHAALGGFIGRIDTNNSKTINMNNSIFAGTFAETKDCNYIGLLIGQVTSTASTTANCSINVDKAYCHTSENWGVANNPIGYVDGTNIVINGVTKTTGTYSASALANASLRNDHKCNTWTNTSTASSLNLNTNVWMDDNTAGTVLLLNGNEDDRVRLDITWYDPTVTATAYTIDTKEQLYGLSYLNNKEQLFTGKTINLGADIKVNNGSVDEWKIDDTNVVTWTPIGTTDAFRGNFNGNGYTISGLYMNTGRPSLFGNAYDGTIQNFKLVNSYVKGNSGFNASVAGNFRGTIKDVYSDVIIDVETGVTSPSDKATGGIAGRLDGASTFENCWYAGDITTDGAGTGGIAGMCDSSSATSYTIKNCLVSGTLTVKITDTRDITTYPRTNAGVGGLVGKAAKTGHTLNLETSLFTGWIVTDDSNLNGKSYTHVGRMLGQLNTSTSAGGLTTIHSYCVNNSSQNVIGYIDSGLVNLDGDTFSGWNYNNVQKLSVDNLRVDNTALGLDSSVWQDVEDDTPILKQFSSMVQ